MQNNNYDMQNNNHALEMYEHNPQDEAQPIINPRFNNAQDEAQPMNLQDADLRYAANVIANDRRIPSIDEPRYVATLNYSPATLHRLDLLCGGMTAISALACVGGVAGLAGLAGDRTASIGAAVTGFVGYLSGVGYNTLREDDIARREEWRQSVENILPRPGGRGVGR